MARTTIQQSLMRWYKAQRAYEYFWAETMPPTLQGLPEGLEQMLYRKQTELEYELDEAIEQLELNLREMMREVAYPSSP
jgi:hypothetical protein